MISFSKIHFLSFLECLLWALTLDDLLGYHWLEEGSSHAGTRGLAPSQIVEPVTSPLT
jgi:hypothetical protein